MNTQLGILFNIYLKQAFIFEHRHNRLLTQLASRQKAILFAVLIFIWEKLTKLSFIAL